jgi:hypothetical protein
MRLFFFLTLFILFFLGALAGWGFLKGFFRAGSEDGKAEADDGGFESPSAECLYRCPYDGVDYLSRRLERGRCVKSPDRCGCPKGKIRCKIGDWHLCLNEIDHMGRKQKCPK